MNQYNELFLVTHNKKPELLIKNIYEFTIFRRLKHY